MKKVMNFLQIIKPSGLYNLYNPLSYIAIVVIGASCFVLGGLTELFGYLSVALETDLVEEKDLAVSNKDIIFTKN